MELLQTIDWALLHTLREAMQCAALDALMPLITHLGSGGALWLLAAGVLLLSKKYRRWGVALLGALAAGVLIGNLTLKPLAARARPCWLEAAELLITMPSDYSFPSGHTLSSAIAATVLTAADRRFGWAAIPLAVLIAVSRLYLFVHFPSDVLAGALLGIGIGSGAAALCRQLATKAKE